MTVCYFAYGSNLDADQMRERCPSAQPGERARLDGHRLGFTHFSKRWDGGAADLLPASDSSVWGVLYRLHVDDLEHLDRFEGGYQRIEVHVALCAAGLGDAGEPHAAVSYSVREKQRHAPREAYVAKMLRWGERWELPELYLEELRSIRTAD